MPEEHVEREYEEVQKRRESSIGNIIKNVSSSQFVIIVILVVLLGLMFVNEYSKQEMMVIGFAIGVFILFFGAKAKQKTLISADYAKRKAIEAIEAEKEYYNIPTDADVRPTNFCKLRWRMNEPLEWSVGVKIETRLGKINYWRVDIHPYDGIITGIVDTPLGFKGDEKPDIIVATPQFVYEE